MSEERTTFIGGMWVQGMADSAPEVAPEPVDGFASAWHKQRFIEDLGRELADLERKLEAVGLPESVRAGHENHKTAVRAEIERLSE
jgi:hypothetical protein